MSEASNAQNQATGGRNVVQVHTIHGGVHFYADSGVEAHQHIPLMVSTSRFLNAEAIVQGYPPCIMPLSGREEIEVLVETRSNQAVILRALRPVILARRPPRDAFLHPIARGILQPRIFEVDLDTDSGSLAPEGANFPFTVTAGDPELFRFSPRISEHEVSWHLELDWICAGQNGRIVINNAGRPFQLYPDEQSMMASNKLRSEPEGTPRFEAAMAAAGRAEVVDYWREVLKERTDLDSDFRRELHTAANELEALVRKQANCEYATNEANNVVAHILSRLLARGQQGHDFLCNNRAFLDRARGLLDGGIPELNEILHLKSG